MLTICKEVRNREELLNSPLPDLWHDLTTKLQSETVCVKPARDGCSTGVARLWYASIHYLHDVTIVSTLKVHIVDMNCEHMGYHMHPCLIFEKVLHLCSYEYWYLDIIDLCILCFFSQKIYMIYISSFSTL